MRPRSVQAAAIQMEATIADVPGNISQAFDLAERAMRAGAEFVALPEFFTTPIILDDRLFGCALPRENPVLDGLVRLARHHGATVGGSYLEQDGSDIYNSYMLVTHEGEVHRHRKDLPTMAECAYYVGGTDDGVFDTGAHTIGVAVCWETIRSATVRRLRGQCDIIMSGSHWWSAPEWRFASAYFGYHAHLNAAHMLRTPGRFARMVGAPMLHGAHSGRLAGRYAITPGYSVPVSTHLVGEAQIVDAQGAILARRTADEGAGVIHARCVLGRIRPAEPVPDRFWLESLPPLVRFMWATQNHVCAAIYEDAKRTGKLTTFGPLSEAAVFKSMSD